MRAYTVDVIADSETVTLTAYGEDGSIVDIEMGSELALSLSSLVLHASNLSAGQERSALEREKRQKIKK